MRATTTSLCAVAILLLAVGSEAWKVPQPEAPRAERKLAAGDAPPCHASCPDAPNTCEKFAEFTAPGGCAYSCTEDAAAWDRDIATTFVNDLADIKDCPEYKAAMPCPCSGSNEGAWVPAVAYAASYGTRCAAWDMYGTYPGNTCNSWCYVDSSQCAAEASQLGVMATGDTSSWTYSKCQDDPQLIANCPSDPNPESYNANLTYYAPYYAANYDPCACNGDTQPDAEKFGTGYGGMCNPWDLGKCGEWWPDWGPADWCCSSWCYTGVACPTSSGSWVDGVQLAYSYDVCPDNGTSGEFSGLMDMCPWPYNGTSLPCTESEKLQAAKVSDGKDMMTNFAPSLVEQIKAICPSPPPPPAPPPAVDASPSAPLLLHCGTLARAVATFVAAALLLAASA